MAEIHVPRAELAELCGLPANATEEELRKRMAELVAAADAREAQAVAAAAEQQLVAEDKRIVEAAINDGRIPANRREFWCAALKNGDRAKNRAVVASLAPVLADIEADRAHARVMAQLGLGPQPPRSVAASFGDWSLSEAEPSPYATADIPRPVLLQKGVDPRDYSREQQYQDFVHKLGIGRRLGVPRPPAGDSYYQPSPNDVTRYDEATGQWVQKQPFKEIP